MSFTFSDDVSPFLDRNGEIFFKKHNLPHWNQKDKYQFVTFRTIDSLPQKEIEELKLFTSNFLRNHPQPWDYNTSIQYRKTITKRKEELLDKGFGACLLKNPVNRRTVEDAIKFYDEDKYDIDSLVIMPNHVHLLVKMIGEADITEVIGSIMRFTATKINKINNRKGALWLREGFDRIIRNEEHYKSCISYIERNPRNLKEGEFTLFKKN